MDMHEWSESYKVYAPFETLLNDVAFDKYHLFQPTVRMLPGFRPAPQWRFRVTCPTSNRSSDYAKPILWEPLPKTRLFRYRRVTSRGTAT